MHNHIKTQTINRCQQKHFAKIRQEGIKDIDKNIKIYPCIYGDKALLAYKSTREYCDKNNIKISNATRGGKLEVFDRVDFDKLF